MAVEMAVWKVALKAVMLVFSSVKQKVERTVA
jgi:hypothetical protein